MGDIRRALQIQGWMSPIELEWLAEIATECKDIIEIGSYKGRSTRALADNCKGKVYCVDTWNGELRDSVGNLEDRINDLTLEEFKKNLEGTNIEIHRGTLKEVFHRLPKADLVFIDANHSYECIKKDIILGLFLTNKIIAGHDYAPYWPEVIQAVDEYFKKVEIIGTIWYVK